MKISLANVMCLLQTFGFIVLAGVLLGLACLDFRDELFITAWAFFLLFIAATLMAWLVFTEER
jgi:hypothetical protein